MCIWDLVEISVVTRGEGEREGGRKRGERDR